MHAESEFDTACADRPTGANMPIGLCVHPDLEVGSAAPRKDRLDGRNLPSFSVRPPNSAATGFAVFVFALCFS